MLGYAAAQIQGSASAAASSHSYLAALGYTAGPLAVAVFVRTLLAGRHVAGPVIRLRWLVTQQVVAFVVVELLEHATTRIGPFATVTEASFVWGLLAQVFVATGIYLLLRAVVFVGERLAVRARVAWPDVEPIRNVHHCSLAWSAVPLSSLSRRGPPTSLPSL